MSDNQNYDDLPTRCGFVALIGAPNAGKSTITNNFVGSKVSIVSPKAVSYTHLRAHETGT